MEDAVRAIRAPNLVRGVSCICSYTAHLSAGIYSLAFNALALSERRVLFTITIELLKYVAD